MGEEMSAIGLEDVEVPVRVKLSALWASVILCYLYGDYFGLYRPGTLQEMIDGRMGPLGPTTQTVLAGTAMLMAIPCVMVFLSLVARPGVGRWLNIVLGVFYTLIMLISMPGAWTFYILLGNLKMVLKGLLVWYEWNWPSGVLP